MSLQGYLDPQAPIRPVKRFDRLCEHIQHSIARLVALRDERFDDAVDATEKIFFGFDGAERPPVVRNFW